MSVQFGGRVRRTLPGYPGIEERDGPDGVPHYRVMTPYINRRFDTADAARDARYELTGKYAHKLKAGTAAAPGHEYITRLRDKWWLKIARLDVKQRFDTFEEAVKARDRALLAAGEQPPPVADDFEAMESFVDLGGGPELVEPADVTDANEAIDWLGLT